MFACSLATAGPPEATTGAWVSPVARAVIERSRAAYASLHGWTATLELESHRVDGDVATVRTLREEERYLGDGRTAGSSVSIRGFPGEKRPGYVSVQNATDRFTVTRQGDGKLEGEVTVPGDWPWRWSGPAARVRLESLLTDASYVGYQGQEVVDGKRCDVIEVLDISLSANVAAQPAKVTAVAVNRFYVDPDGFIVRWMTRYDDFESPARTLDRWDDNRVSRYDAGAKLSADDFSRAAFEREARVMLEEGERLPSLEQKEFRSGERLPDLQFIGWADGKPFRLSDLQGRIVVVETWASWCHFCKVAFPYYEKMRQALEAQGVVFVALSFDQRPSDYEKWMNANAGKYGFRFGLVDAPDARAAMQEFRGSLPGFYVLGRDGRIVSTYSGYAYGVGVEDPRLLQALRQAGVKLP